MIKKKIFRLVIILIFGIALIYIGYKFNKAYKNIENEKEDLGYKSPCKSLPPPVFTRGEWRGVLIDANINFTDGAHNIVPYDIDDDGKIELIANSYRSDAIIFYKYNSDPHDSSNWSRYVIDSSAGGGNSRRPIMKFIKFTVKEKLLGEFTSGAHYTAIADMNGDGRSDLIIACDHKNYDIVWYETPKDIRRIPAWTKHIVYKNDLYRTYHVETGDIDGDGDRDIAFTTKTDNSIGWVENTGLEGQWHSCLIDNNCVSCFNVRVADIDKDGKDEIIASEDDSKNGGK